MNLEKELERLVVEVNKEEWETIKEEVEKRLDEKELGIHNHPGVFRSGPKEKFEEPIIVIEDSEKSGIYTKGPKKRG